MFQFTKVLAMFCILLTGWSTNIARGQDNAGFVRVLCAVVADESQPIENRIDACNRLAKFGRSAKQAAPALLKAFAYDGELARASFDGAVLITKGLDLRHEALKALKAIQPDAHVLVPAVVKALGNIRQDYDNVPVEAPPHHLVGDREPVSPTPGHNQYLDMAFCDFIVAMFDAVKAYGPEAHQSVDVIVQLLQDKREILSGIQDPDANAEGLRVWPWCQTKARIAAANALAAIANSSDLKAINALDEIGAFSGRKEDPFLNELLLNDQRRVEDNLKKAVRKALDKIKKRQPQPMTAAPPQNDGAASEVNQRSPKRPAKMSPQEFLFRLKAFLKHPDPEIRQRAAELLRALSSSHASQANQNWRNHVMKVLIQYLQSKDARHRQNAAAYLARPENLARLGPKATDAAPVLLRLIKEDESSAVKASAKKALMAILRND